MDSSLYHSGDWELVYEVKGKVREVNFELLRRKAVEGGWLYRLITQHEKATGAQITESLTFVPGR
jgi:hypothetical protein